MSWFSRCLLVGVAGSVSFSCGVPVSDSKYEVVGDPFDRIVAAYASGGPSCDECLRNTCRNEIEACADTAACAG